MTKKDDTRVDAFEMWCHGRLLRVPWPYMSYILVLDQGPGKSSAVRTSRFVGHVAR